MNGIFLRKEVKIANPQALWNPPYNATFVYSDITKNGALRDNANNCAYYGFHLGLYHRLRYPPEEGSADSQAQEFMIAENAIMNIPDYKYVKFVTPVLHLEKGTEVLCETKMYREMVMTFWKKYQSYHGQSQSFILKMTDEFMKWLQPTAEMVGTFKLWIHEPTTNLVYAPWKSYVYRSYASRAVEGTPFEPVDTWTGTPPTPTTPPASMTPEQRLAAIDKIIHTP